MPSARPLRLVPLLLSAGVAAGWPAAATAAKVPDIVLDAGAAESAAHIDAPIAEVTVYSDRARVRRRGRVTVLAGPRVVRFPDVPGSVFLDTIRVGATGGRVLRVEATPIERERLEIDQAKKLLDDLDAINDRLSAVADRAAVDDLEVGLVTRLAPAPPVPEEKREGRKGLVVDVGSWWKALDFLGERTNAARTRLVRIADERRPLEGERDRLRAEIVKLNQGGFSDRSVEVIAVLDVTGSRALEIELEYFVPGARWKPAYNLYFSSARGQLTMETAAMVQQTTGEDWERAALSFSTATPGRGVDLPELLTWTLGERSDFVPHLTARKPPRVEPLLPMPQMTSPAKEARAIEGEIVRERLARAAAAPAARDVEESAVAPSAEPEIQRRTRASREIQDLVANAMADRAPRMQRAIAPRSATDDLLEGALPAPPSVAMASGSRSEAQSSDDESESDERTTSWRDVVAVPRRLGKSSPLKRAMPLSLSLSLYDATSARRAPIFADPDLPAVSAGGLDYVYRLPTPVTVESSGKESRIPLATQSFRTAAFYEATPALATTAFLRARVRNDGKRPLLRGPAAIFGDGEFVGQGEIQTTGPGGDIEFPLGADQDIRLVRQVVPTTKTTGLIIKSQETVYDVQIQIGNYKKRSVTVELVDQVPRSQNDDIEIKLLGTDPAPLGAADTDGVLRWRVSVPAGGTQVVKLRYQIMRPKDWKLYQR